MAGDGLANLAAAAAPRRAHNAKVPRRTVPEFVSTEVALRARACRGTNASVSRMAAPLAKRIVEIGITTEALLTIRERVQRIAFGIYWWYRFVRTFRFQVNPTCPARYLRSADTVGPASGRCSATASGIRVVVGPDDFDTSGASRKTEDERREDHRALRSRREIPRNHSEVD